MNELMNPRRKFRVCMFAIILSYIVLSVGKNALDMTWPMLVILPLFDFGSIWVLLWMLALEKRMDWRRWLLF